MEIALPESPAPVSKGRSRVRVASRGSCMLVSREER